jgi:hypothetical protein
MDYNEGFKAHDLNRGYGLNEGFKAHDLNRGL